MRRGGDQFIRELYERGVRNFVLSNSMSLAEYPRGNFILVKDSLKALQKMAAWHRRQFNYPVIGITGSNGKTIVKEWLNQMLEDRFNIVRSPKSYNSQIGVPLSVWQMSDDHDLGIFEAGISQTGEMKNLEEIIKPTIGIFTNIGEAHSQGFKNEEKKIKEKLLLFRKASVLIYCKDQRPIETLILARSKKNDMKLISWGKTSGSLIRIRQLKKAQGNSSVTLAHNCH
jgi:alanine racemase